jgi:hypothetical protein
MGVFTFLRYRNEADIVAEEYCRYLLFHPNFEGRLSDKRNWLFIFPEVFDIVTALLPDFTTQTTGLCLGRQSYVEQIDASFFSKLPVFPNVADLELHVSWDSNGPLNLYLLQTLFPSLKCLSIADPGAFVGGLNGLAGLEELTLDQWYRCELCLIPNDSVGSLTRLNLIGCFEGELEDAEEDKDESEIGLGIRELRKFENLSHLHIDPVHVGVESLLDTCTFSLETLHVTILLRSSNFDEILTPRPGLRNLRTLELMIFRWYRIEGCAPTAAFLESIIQKVVQISTLENVLLQMPFHRWARHFKSLCGSRFLKFQGQIPPPLTRKS